jgi:hypothetical protein
MDLEGGIPSKRRSSACVDYVPALCTHRPSLLPISSGSVSLSSVLTEFEELQTWSLRGRRSRNKVSVGEPAEGSIKIFRYKLSLYQIRIISYKHKSADQILTSVLHLLRKNKEFKFSTVDVLALISMKNAAKCDKQCELQTVSH